uniref:Uncharacterized protein n=1 Tax=Cucumis melo TaxID=3656 RepID=A0A9I9E7X4_CUCME
MEQSSNKATIELEDGTSISTTTNIIDFGGKEAAT